MCVVSQITDPDAAFLSEPEAWIQWLCERGLNPVQKRHAVRHLVECQSSLCELQIDPDPVVTAGRPEQDAVAFVTHRIVLGQIETPGQCIGPESGSCVVRFSFYSFVGEGDLCLLPLHLDLVVAALSLQSLPAQHLSPTDKPIWVINSRDCIFLRAQLHLFISFRNTEALMSCSGIQSNVACICEHEEKKKRFIKKKKEKNFKDAVVVKSADQ